MAENLPPDWAIERALTLGPTGATLEYVKRHWPGHTAHIAFARYIAEHEEPPIDPLLIEAREIVCRRHQSADMACFRDNVTSGRCDSDFRVTFALDGLRRGIEIAKEQSHA